MTIPMTAIFWNGYKLILEAKWEYVFLFPISSDEPKKKWKTYSNFSIPIPDIKWRT